MPTIIAICPYCRAGGVRAPDNALGASATCPKCKSSFTVLPEEKLPDWAASAKPDAGSFSAPSEKSRPTEETRATASMPDVTEPSPVLPAEPRPEKKKAKGERREKAKSEPEAKRESSVAPPTPAAPAAVGTPVAATAGAEAEESPAALADMGMMFALAALILVGPAVLASQLPYGRFIALPLALAGLVGGLLCLGSEGKPRLAGSAAAFLHFLLLVVVLFLPSWLNLDPWSGPAKAEEPKGPQAVDNRTAALSAIAPNDWLDAAKYSWQFRDVRVTVQSAVGPVELTGPKGAKRTPKKQYLYLTLQVRNSGYERELPLSGWATGQTVEGVRVTDAEGKPLELAKFEEGWAPPQKKPVGRAVPGHAVEALLIFTAPPAKSEFVRVQLAGAAVGVQEEIKFRTGTVGLLPQVAVPKP